MIDLSRAMESELRDKTKLLRSIVETFFRKEKGSFREKIISECLEREEEASTMVAGGIAFPHAVLDEAAEPRVLCCLAQNGVPWNSAGDEARIVILLVCRQEDHLPTLSALASILRMPGVEERLAEAVDAEEMMDLLRSAAAKKDEDSASSKIALSDALIRSLPALTDAVPRSRIVLFSNSPMQIITLCEKLGRKDIILVSSKKEVFRRKEFLIDHVALIYKAFSLNDRKAVLKELWTEKIIEDGDSVICLTGFEFMDTPRNFTLYDIPQDLYDETRVLSYKIPHDVNLEILSRAVSLASELSLQGREGKPAGTIFVVGAYEEVKPYCRQLIINPFGGLEDHDRSILDPGLSETIKEFSKIDGAYIVDNSGRIRSGGTYLSVPPHNQALKPGLGARHAAALGITLVAPVATVVISESTGEIRVFWDGSEQDLFHPGE